MKATNTAVAMVVKQRRGNPNWGKPSAVPEPPPVPTSFESKVEELHLSPAMYSKSPQLHHWVSRNFKKKFVPEALLKVWGMDTIDVD